MAKISRRSVASNSSPADSNANSIASPTNDNSANNNINNKSTNSKPKSLSTNYSSSISHNHVNSDIPSSLSKTTIHTSQTVSSEITSQQQQEQEHDTSFPDPLRSNGSQFTTRTIPNGHHNNNSYRYTSATQQVSSQSSSRGAAADKTYTNNRISTTPLPSSTTTSLAGHPSIIIPYSNFSDHHNITQAQILAAERERIRAEFFATYDVMTGVRIAATLGGFFSLMVFLIVWKSRSHTDETLRVLKDPKIAAVAAACMQEEEERKIQEAMEATGMSIYPDEYDAILYRRQRMLSLGNVSAPPVLHRGYRFSSVGGGGYSSLLEPPRRYSYSYGGGRRKSGSESSRILTNYPMGSSFGTDDYFMETDDELENPEFEESHRRTDSVKRHGFLEVPNGAAESRRSSAMTCCSTESSYLERRCSALTLGLGNLPPSLRRKLSTASRTSSNDMWDYYYPDIQVIQPTPSASPCPSGERIINDQATSSSHPTTEASAASIIKTAISSSTTAATNQQKPITTTQAASAASSAIAPHFVRKQSIAYYDPESAQSGRQQHIHSISADTADILPYPMTAKVVQLHEKYDDSSELKLVVRRKISAPLEGTTTTTNGRLIDNNNSYTYSNEFAATATGNNGGNNSIGSLGSAADLSKNITANTAAAGAGPKRAPLASLSSFKISSIEYQDSEMRSLDEDSVFLDSIADTDEDMEQFSTDSDEISLEDDVIEDGSTKVPTSNTVASPISNISTSHNHDDLHSVKSVPPNMSQYSTDIRRAVSNVSSFKRPARRPILERHKSISIATSTEKISLIGHQMKDFSQQQSSFDSENRAPPPLETHFTILPRQDTTESTPSSQRRLLMKPQLQQQISAEQTTEETTTNTTTTTAETCSTFNTEIPQGQQFYGGPDEIVASSNQHSLLPLITMPASLKNLIRQNSPPACSSVILELPLIKLPTTDESSDNSYVDNNDDDDKSRSKSDESRDPSLPGSSRKWSRETLF
ncbi:uncharacterized protein LOC129906719 [Episyrphus balteatus]|uniref:uncharacterized protein LOC129906719 n=1 Tax=Episyrphus balteatus TaxID=286459 RepID=UPI0024853262|nr:uncharacterized protein LOC129906719 [Episyrphus balteatus]